MNIDLVKLAQGVIECEREREEQEKDKYCSPNGSKWIVAIANDGKVEILGIPNIHYSFTDDARSAEEFGLPDYFETDFVPGVYEWTCNLSYSTDWETGFIDVRGFEIISEKLLYSWQDGEVNKG